MRKISASLLPAIVLPMMVVFCGRSTPALIPSDLSTTESSFSCSDPQLSRSWEATQGKAASFPATCQELASMDPCDAMSLISGYGIVGQYKDTGDKSLIEKAFPVAKQYLGAFTTDKQGFLCEPAGGTPCRHGADKTMLLSSWHLLALQGLSDMADMVGAEGEGSTIWGHMTSIRESLAQAAWNGQSYAHPDYKGAPDPIANAVSVLAGLKSGGRQDALCKTIADIPDNISQKDRMLVAEALFAIGHGAEAIAVEKNGTGPAIFPTKAFGLAATEPGWKKFSVRPDREILPEKCTLVYPTATGTVAIAYDREGNILEIRVPEGATADIDIPWNYSHFVLTGGIHRVCTAKIEPPAPGTYPYQNASLSVDRRVKDLMGRMNIEEKVAQASAQLLFMDEYYARRNYTAGHVRNVGHFMVKASPMEVAQAINEDTRRSIQASRWGIPVLQNGEALHGAQWGEATCFPQSIAMGATFDDELYYRAGQVVAKELRAVGVRQVYAPVINITRDQRWGRGQESYGEDVLLNSTMGVAYVKALEEGGVVATPKHYVDNYGEGGHDSFASTTSWRVLREVYLEPFRAVFQEGGARSVMSAYNSVDGIPASCSNVLLNDILRDEWGFRGFVISDYGAVEIVHDSHRMATSRTDALALCLENGLDIQMHTTDACLLDLVKTGKISRATLDKIVERVLRVKFELGLFDEPFVDETKADGIVRCDEHKDLAYQAACESMTLLKNNGILPLKPGSVRKIGMFGPAAATLNTGDYSGDRGGWHAPDAPTPYTGMKEVYGDKTEVVLAPAGQDVAGFARTCDVLVFFPSITEEEGSDRSSFNLPSANTPVFREQTGAVIIADQKENTVRIDQEKMIRDLVATGKPVVVVLHNGAVIDISNWVDGVAAVLEAWYPGEQGGRAIADILSGAKCPGGRLPFSWVRNIGQNPMYYSIKPSGRGYGYVENDGSPLYPFGYGLSYTSFEYFDFEMPEKLAPGEPLRISVKVTNTGQSEGDEVVQLYAHDETATVARPIKELVAYKRVSLAPGQSTIVELEVPYRRFAMWDTDMKFRVEEGWSEVWLGRDSATKIAGGRVFVSGSDKVD